jgi:KOW motif
LVACLGLVALAASARTLRNRPRAGAGGHGPEASRYVASWARRVRARLREAGLRIQARATDGPVAVVFARAGVDIDEAHVRLVLSTDARGIEVALEIPAGEARAVRARLAEPERALQVTAALEALPEQFAMRVAEESTPLPAPHATTDDVRALLDRAEVQRRSFLLGWAIDRETALEHAAVLDEQLEDAVVALGPTFALLADSGAASTSAASSGSASARLRSGRGHDSAYRRAEDDRHGHVAKRRARSHYRDDDRTVAAAADRDRESDAEAEPEPTRDREPPARPLRGGALKPRGRSLGDKIEKGARVRVLEGPFAGKVGVVQELDGKGGARVMMGLLAVRLAVKDLAISVERHDRPLLSSSHRRPVPARS